MSSQRAILLAAIAGLTAVGTGISADPPRPSASENEPFSEDLLKAAREYRTWGRVDDEMRWAPTLCRSPNPGRVYESASQDDETHGQKLYSLFARKRNDYVALKNGEGVAVGQTIVKQSWVAEEITDPKERPGKQIDFEKVIRTPVSKSGGRQQQRNEEGDHFYPYVWKGEKVFKAKEQSDLFIMMKFDSETPGTDAGWIYGTVTPDGKKVVSVGKIESCMKCHEEARKERLFGLAK